MILTDDNAPEPMDQARCRRGRTSSPSALVPLAYGGMFALLASSVGSFACGASEGGAMCVAESPHALTNGVKPAAYLMLEPWEEQAVVYLDIALDSATRDSQCTGVLIATQWVLTAAHCLEGGAPVETRVALGASESRPILETRGSAWLPHPTLDLALVHLEADVPAAAAVPLRLAEVVPAWFGEGQLVQVAGYGFDQNGARGSRTFLVERVLLVQDQEVRVSADGFGGACLGDSGGPLLIRGGDGRVEVLGVLSHGSSSCYGADSYARADTVAAWISQQIAAAPGAAQPEGLEYRTLTTAGRCFGDVAVWREGKDAHRELCGGGQACGFDAAARGFRCVPAGTDPCLGITDIGDCAGTTTRRCLAGRVQMQDCALCEAACGFSPASGAASCVEATE